MGRALKRSKRLGWGGPMILAAALSPAMVSVASALTPVTDAMLARPDPADWLMWRRTLDSWGYSPLTQVNRANVGSLVLAWSKPLESGSQETTPLIHEGVLFMAQPNDVVQAFNAVTGKMLWEYRRKIPADLTDYVRFPPFSRNAAIYGDLLINTSGDGHLYALDLATGAVRWDVQIIDYRRATARQSTGPIIADGLAITGRNCEPRGGPAGCVIVANDARTGQERWRTHTIPKPGEPGSETWGKIPYEARWHVGSWMVPSFDPKLGLIYVGTSVTSPAPKFALDGADKQYLYHNSTLALDVKTGRIKWYYQHLVDNWDFDHPFERMLIDVPVTPDLKAVAWIGKGAHSAHSVPVVTGIPGKTGIIYTLDRRTGQFLWARPTVRQNVVAAIDPDGRVHENPATVFTGIGRPAFVCPASHGGKNWPAGAYSPKRGLMYFPLQNTCAQYTAILDKPDLQSLYGFSMDAQIAPGTTKVGSIYAISPATGKTSWKYDQRAGTLSLLATGGGVLFGGDAAGHFRAFDDRNGRILLDVNLGSPVSGYPVTFRAAGRQYVAVTAGPAMIPGVLNVLTPEIKTGQASRLFVFALRGPGVTPVPIPAAQAVAPASTANSAAIAEGANDPLGHARSLYAQHCAACHGADMSGGPSAPALKGPEFRFRWKNRPASQLRAILDTMPLGAPQIITAKDRDELLALMKAADGQ